MPTIAQAKTARTINFQGRLLSKQGGPVADGRYNIEFTIYDGGDGQTAHNPNGQRVWSESYKNTSHTKGVPVKNGYFSVQLGSQTAFGSKINWGHSPLWLSMNVAGMRQCKTFDKGACRGDGEMLPMKQLSAASYALDSDKLDGKSADNFVQIGQGQQTDSSDGSSIFLNKTGNGNLIQLQHNGDNSFTVSRDGDITLSGSSDKAVTLSDTTSGDGKSLTIGAGTTHDLDGNGGDLLLSGGSGGSSAASGGNIVLSGGTSADGDSNGLVIIGTPTFSTTTTDPGCYTNGKVVSDDCAISQKSIDTGAATVVGFSQKGKTATLPAPSQKMAGRIIYVIGASDSLPFTLRYNDTARATVEPETALSLMWTGHSWATIGGSSSQQETTLTEQRLGNATLHATPDAATEHDLTKTKPASKPKSATSKKTAKQPTDETSRPTKSAAGSMYFDAKKNKIQCYNDGAWSDCLSAPDAYVTISPEYSNAVMNGTDIGTITSDICSDSLDINNGSDDQADVCAKNETHNFYQWSTKEDESQTRSIFITHKLPDNFKQFVKKSTSLLARTNDHDNAAVSYQLYRDNKKTGLTSCGKAIEAPDSSSQKWTTVRAKKLADPANCDFTPGDSLLIRINLTAKADASAYVSDVNFAYKTTYNE